MKNATRLNSMILAAATAGLAGSGCMMVDIGALGKRELQEVTVEKAGGWFVSEKVLLVDISGEMADVGDDGLFGGFACTPHYLRAVLRRAEEDADVRAVVLRIDSPGGGVGASERMAREVAAFRERTGKPVYANITGLGCSGAYYIAAGCGRIDAQPSAIVGSIGVIAILPRYQRLADKIGFEQEVIKSGRLKDMGSGMRAMTDEERRVFQDLIDADYRSFLEWVAARRAPAGGLEKVRALADGRVFTARQAADNGLIDGIAFLDETIAAARDKAGLKDAEIVSYVYDAGMDANLYTPAGSARARGPLDVRLPDALRPHAGLYYLWQPGP